KVYNIGQDITVRVVRADLERIHIDFELYDPRKPHADKNTDKLLAKKSKKPKKAKKKRARRRKKTKTKAAQ
ncbi:hypothetical protein IB622_00015, partial [Francisella orientalis]